MYKRNQRVDSGTLKRARRRARKMGGAEGVDFRDGLTGGEARKVKRQYIAAGRPTHDPNPDTTPRSGGGRRPARNKKKRQEVDPFRREVNARTHLQFAGQERELEYRRSQERQFAANTQSYYQQHIQDMQAAQARFQGYAQGVQAAQLQASQNAAQVDAGQNAQQVAKMQADAQQRGTTVDPQLLAQMQAGVQARQVMGNAGGALIGAQGQNASANMVTQQQQAGEYGLQANADSMARQRRLDQLAADLAADKGAFKVKAGADLRREAQRTALENAAFGLDVQQEKNDQRNANRSAKQARLKERRRIMEADRKYQLDLQKFGADQAKDNYQRRHGLGPYKAAAPKNGGRPVRGDVDGDGIADRGKYRGFSESERDKYDTAISKLAAMERGGKTKEGKRYGGPGYVRANSQLMIDSLIDKGIPPRIARRAVRRFTRRHTGSIRPQTGTPVG